MIHARNFACRAKEGPKQEYAPNDANNTRDVELRDADREAQDCSRDKKESNEADYNNIPTSRRTSARPSNSHITAPTLQPMSKSKKQCTYSDPERPYMCMVAGCGLRFKRTDHLRRHNRSVHLALKPFGCPVCSHVTARRENLMQHLELKHRWRKKRARSAAKEAGVAETTAVAAGCQNKNGNDEEVEKDEVACEDDKHETIIDHDQGNKEVFSGENQNSCLNYRNTEEDRRKRTDNLMAAALKAWDGSSSEDEDEDEEFTEY
ncbi:hypothetical protein N0V90_006125 [Kalmusia sp. IMI 367209]|nr:hypothetical protein N0V90_006125 [Kalmusia sp. IMI 367209]